MKCEVCGGKIWPDDYLKAYLCAGHLRQAEECINILKGEQKEPLAFPILRDGELVRYAEFIPHVESATGKVDYFTVDGVKFMPEKPKVWYATEKDDDGYAIWRHDTIADTITFYTQIGTEQADALYSFMEKERHGA